MLTGLLTVGAWFYGLTLIHHSWATLTLALAVALFFDSFVAFVGPKRIFYSSALLSALLAGSELVGSGPAATPVTFLTIAMAAVTLALSMLAARLETAVSEQSNPMNLPVFG